MIECCPLCGSPDLLAVCEGCDREVWTTTSAGTPGRERLSGWRMHDYGHALTALDNARRSQGAALRELAGHAGSTASTLSRDFRGVHRMAADTMISVADALGFDLALIPRGSADNPDAPSARPVRP